MVGGGGIGERRKAEREREREREREIVGGDGAMMWDKIKQVSTVGIDLLYYLRPPTD